MEIIANETLNDACINSIDFEGLANRLEVEDLHQFQKDTLIAFRKKKDIFLVVPTGSGKSFCYIMPALISPGLVLVICPLIALMREQAARVRSLGISSASLDSSCSLSERAEVISLLQSGKIKVLFVSPERMAQASFRLLLQAIPIALIAIDEAHCVHQWGQGFRPEYKKIGKYIDEIPHVPRMALTATVTRKERIDICLSLGLTDPQLIEKVIPRYNLELKIISHKNLESRKAEIQARISELRGQGIIYCSTRRSAEDYYNLFSNRGEKVELYHAGVSSFERSIAQDKFTRGESRILVATKAFGMGLDLAEIRFVIHADMPCSIESYAQEVGRAGRDGLQSICELHYGPKDFYIQKFMIEKDFPPESEFEKVLLILQGMFERQHLVSLHDVFSSANNALAVKQESVGSVIRFLYREDYLSPSDDMESTVSQEALLWTRSGKELALPEIIFKRQEQYNWRMGKLRSMHSLIKNGSSGVREFINSYFN